MKSKPFSSCSHSHRPETGGVSIILSCSATSLSDISKHNVGGLIRRKAPSVKVGRVYFYATSPVSAVIGYAGVVSQEKITADDACGLSEFLCLSSGYIREYVGHRPFVGLIRFGNVSISKHPIGLNKLADLTGLRPPQNFQVISDEEERELSSYLETGR